MESGDFDDTGEFDENIANQPAMANVTKIRQRLGDNLNEITEETPCKVTKLTDMANLTKMVNLAGENREYGIQPWFGKYSMWIQKGLLGETQF